MGRISASLAIGRPAELPDPGDYLTDGTNLYCVEEVFDDHALIEDCRSGVLIDVSLRMLEALEPVRPSSEPERSAPAGA